MLLQRSVSGVAVSLLVSALTVDILSTFRGVVMVRCVKLILTVFEVEVLLFDCFVYSQNIGLTSLKRLPGMGITQMMENIIITDSHLFLKTLCQKIQHLVAVL